MILKSQDNAKISAAANVWRYAAYLQRFNLRKRTWSWFTWSKEPEITELTPSSARYFHVAIGLLRGLVRSSDGGARSLQLDADSLKKHHAVESLEVSEGKASVRFNLPGEKLVCLYSN